MLNNQQCKFKTVDREVMVDRVFGGGGWVAVFKLTFQLSSVKALPLLLPCCCIVLDSYERCVFGVY